MNHRVLLLASVSALYAQSAFADFPVSAATSSYQIGASSEAQPANAADRLSCAYVWFAYQDFLSWDKKSETLEAQLPEALTLDHAMAVGNLWISKVAKDRGISEDDAVNLMYEPSEEYDGYEALITEALGAEDKVAVIKLYSALGWCARP